MLYNGRFSFANIFDIFRNRVLSFEYFFVLETGSLGTVCIGAYDTFFGVNFIPLTLRSESIDILLQTKIFHLQNIKILGPSYGGSVHWCYIRYV